jgi:hypothetical protein
MGVAVRAYSMTSKYHVAESSDFKSEGAAFAKLMKYEDDVEATIPVQRVKVANTNVWNTVELVKSDRRCRNTFENVEQCLAKNLRAVAIDDNSGRERMQTRILMVSGDFALVNRHAFEGKHLGSVMYIYPLGKSQGSDSVTTEVRISEYNYVPVNYDLALIRTTKSCRSILHFFRNVSTQPSVGISASIGGVPTTALVMHNLKVKAHELLTFDTVYRYEWPGHMRGTCGTPLVGDIEGGKMILGIHCAGSAHNTESYAIPVSLPQIETAIREMERISIFPPILSEAFNVDTVMPGLKSCTNYEDLSGMRYLGRIDKPITFSKKSKVKKTPYGDYIANRLGVKMKDLKGPIMGPPPMTAFFKDGEYINPYNVNVKALNVQKPALDHERCKKVIDIVTTHLTEKMPDLKIKPLTVSCAINGHNHDAYLRSMNTATSAGF